MRLPEIESLRWREFAVSRVGGAYDGLIFSTLGAILVLYVCYKLKIHLPRV
jgi:hypothetical protein